MARSFTIFLLLTKLIGVYEYQGIVSGPEPPAWDVDGNGAIDISDLILVSNVLGTSGHGLPADVNGDDVVDIMVLRYSGMR